MLAAAGLVDALLVRLSIVIQISSNLLIRLAIPTVKRGSHDFQVAGPILQRPVCQSGMAASGISRTWRARVAGASIECADYLNAFQLLDGMTQWGKRTKTKLISVPLVFVLYFNSQAILSHLWGRELLSSLLLSLHHSVAGAGYNRQGCRGDVDNCKRLGSDSDPAAMV